MKKALEEFNRLSKKERGLHTTIYINPFSCRNKKLGWRFPPPKFHYLIA